MEKAKQLSSGKWRIRVPVPGTTSRESVTDTSARKVEEKAIARIAELASERTEEKARAETN